MKIIAKKRPKLSDLQKKYRKFFKKRLKDFNVKSPAELDEEGKIEFFGGIPDTWLKEKKEFMKKEAKAAINESPLNIAIIETSEVVATLNSLLRTALKQAPEDIKATTRAALKVTKMLLKQLAEEIRED